LSHFRVLSSWIPRGKATPDRSMRMRRRVCESSSRRVAGGCCAVLCCCAAVWLTSLSSLLHSFTPSLTHSKSPTTLVTISSLHHHYIATIATSPSFLP
jgi:hypothetical protein